MQQRHQLGKAHPSAVRHQVNEYYCAIAYLALYASSITNISSDILISSSCRGIDILNAVVVVFTIALEIFMYFRYRQMKYVDHLLDF